MNVLQVITAWGSHLSQDVHTHATLLTVALLVGGGLGAAVWPRGCCKEDSIFSRHVM
jgi:hypothetical protein